MTTLPTTSLANPTPTLLTAAEFTARYANIHAELVKGIVKEYPGPWPKHGFICSTAAWILKNHVMQNDLGRVATNDSWIQTGKNPDTVRGADVCFFSYERLPKGDVPEGLLPVVPDLVVEVRSPSDRWINIFAKIGDYLGAGVRAVVVLDPITSSASVYRPDEIQQIFHNGDQLVLPEILPGFAIPVNQFFA